MKDMNALVTELVSAAEAGDRDTFSEVFADRGDIDGNQLLQATIKACLKDGKFEAAVLVNRALENRHARTGLRQRRAAAVALSLTDATDEQLLAEVKRRGLT